ncbi:MAG: aminotransferase class I/II-fold pyridoxal phosphate-dependent enzyme [archaeon]|nr:aminotransferase class I/II-fold pyridoxal phosphate-dependent enzyme [archaeon]
MKKVEPAKKSLNVKHAIRDLVPIAEEVEASGKEVLYLNIGDPIVYDFRTPEHLWEAMNSNRRKCEGYANAIGAASTRQAVADYAKSMGANGVTKNDAIIFVGGSEAIILSLQALMNQGENILVPRPGYSVYNGELTFLECKHNEYDLNEENKWMADIDSMRKQINAKTRGIVIINPNNPTGSVLTRKNLQGIIDLAGEHDLPVFSDETYDKITYDDAEFISAASVAKDVPLISLGSISKTYLAPGFRGGWLYKQDPSNALDDYFAALHRLCRLRLTNVAPTQPTIEAALNGPQDHIKEMVTKLQKRRDLTYKRLNEIEGIYCDKPRGAFYAFPKIEFPVESDREFVLDLLREKGVLVVYGSGFGQKEGTKHFRVVFLPPEEILNSAFDKIEELIKEKYLK